MFIQTQNTPDANVMNFFPDKKLMKNSQAEFVDAKTLRKSPLAENIFDLGGVESIFISPEMLSVTKTSEASWDDLKPLILAEIMDFLATGAEIVLEDENGSDEEIIFKIKGIIEARIRPAVMQDKGDIDFVKYENGIVFVEMKGACAGCPYAAVTLKEGVEKVLKSYVPEVKAVENCKA